ncbi:MAG: RnfABCDGE type electron transport complex subunit A [Lachnospiraceae bacterium]|nr:RnfABCDGE type electron transport complex subunit A [Lachnospiraceae bacterium]MBQ7864585.1 RnfABCDGE type electron transport complex subunit A [Lachnospiraceae bacterium]
MKEMILILIGSALVNNVVLSQFLGLCPFLGVSKKTKTAASMGAAVIFVIMIASAVTYAVHYMVLVPLGMEYMQTIVFILVIAALVQMIEMMLKKVSPPIYSALGVYLPLITTNCAVLGVAITNIQNGSTFGESMMNSLGTSFGFLIAIVIMAGIRERLEGNDIPKAFRGMPIVLITSGLMAIAFCGFAGII